MMEDHKARLKLARALVEAIRQGLTRNDIKNIFRLRDRN